MHYLLNKIWGKLFPSKNTTPAGHVNFESFTHQVQLYKSRGTQIGKKVRLLGRIDGINPHLVTIGDYSIIGAQSTLLAHCPINGVQPCHVGNFVYIGFGALILPGVSIGDHCIIGAGAVVTKNIPANSIAVGNPAKILRSLTQIERENIQQTMLEGRLFGLDKLS